MPSTENQTEPTSLSVGDFLHKIQNDSQRNDSFKLIEMMKEITRKEPILWGSIIGFGTYHYKYESGREGDFMVTGFSPRKTNLTIYIMPGYQDYSDYLAKLGKHKVGKSCLYIKKLDDIDITVLKDIIQAGVEYMKNHYVTDLD